MYKSEIWRSVIFIHLLQYKDLPTLKRFHVFATKIKCKEKLSRAKTHIPSVPSFLLQNTNFWMKIPSDVLEKNYLEEVIA